MNSYEIHFFAEHVKEAMSDKNKARASAAGAAAATIGGSALAGRSSELKNLANLQKRFGGGKGFGIGNHPVRLDSTAEAASKGLRTGLRKGALLAIPAAGLAYGISKYRSKKKAEQEKKASRPIGLAAPYGLLHKYRQAKRAAPSKLVRFPSDLKKAGLIKRTRQEIAHLKKLKK